MLLLYWERDFVLLFHLESLWLWLDLEDLVNDMNRLILKLEIGGLDNKDQQSLDLAIAARAIIAHFVSLNTILI